MVSLAMIVLIVMIGIIYHMITVYSEEKNINQINDLGYSLQSEIILAAEVEPGYSRNIFIPETIGSFNYTLRIKGDELLINYKGSDFIFPIPNVTTEDAAGITSKGIHTISKPLANTISIT